MVVKAKEKNKAGKENKYCRCAVPSRYFINFF